MPLCKACKTEIIWLGGQVNPVEAEANPDGNLVVSKERGLYRFATKEEIEFAKETGKKLYISHFAKCGLAKIFKGANAKTKQKRSKL